MESYSRLLVITYIETLCGRVHTNDNLRCLYIVKLLSGAWVPPMLGFSDEIFNPIYTRLSGVTQDAQASMYIF